MLVKLQANPVSLSCPRPRRSSGPAAVTLFTNFHRRTGRGEGGGFGDPPSVRGRREMQADVPGWLVGQMEVMKMGMKTDASPAC